jgi:hypothetical protein
MAVGKFELMHCLACRMPVCAVGQWNARVSGRANKAKNDTSHSPFESSRAFPSCRPQSLVTMQDHRRAANPTPAAGGPAAARIAVGAGAGAAALLISLVLAPHAVGAVLLDFEGVENAKQVYNFYAGGGGGPTKNYGITFGTAAAGAVDADANPMGYNIANEPSPNTTVFWEGDESQAFFTVPGGFLELSFQYASLFDVTATVYDGPDQSGRAIATTSLPPPGSCDQSVCGDPMGTFGVWSNATVAFAGVAQSVGFSPSTSFLFVDDVLVRLVSEETNSPTKAPARPPTKPPTKAPTARAPTKSPSAPACLRKGVKGDGMRCMKMKMMMKPKVA